MKDANKKEKECSRCHRFLPLSMFNKRTRSKDGLESYCRECNQKRNKEYRERFKREIKTGQRKYDTPKKKKCRECHRILNASEFTIHSFRKDGLSTYCKKCEHKRQEEYRSQPKVKEILDEYQKEYRKRPDVKLRKREYSREYARKPELRKKKREYERRPERKQKKKEYMKEYLKRPSVKERMKKYRKEYYSRSDVIEKRKQYLKEYLNRSEVKERRKKYYKEYKHRPENIEKIKQYQREYYRKKKMLNDKLMVTLLYTAL